MCAPHSHKVSSPIQDSQRHMVLNGLNFHSPSQADMMTRGQSTFSLVQSKSAFDMRYQPNEYHVKILFCAKEWAVRERFHARENVIRVVITPAKAN